MNQLSRRRGLAPAGALLWLVAACSAVGGLARGDARAVLTWALLGLTVAAVAVRPLRRAAYALAAAGAAAVAALDATWLSHGAAASHSRAEQLVLLGLTPALLLVTPAIVGYALSEFERLRRQVQYQASVIDDLTIRDTSTGAFKPRYIESIVADEVDRARRYHRSLTLALLAADDWDEVLAEFGEIGARNLAARIMDQLAKGTRTVDRIVQMGDGAFALVLPETPLEGAEVLTARLQAAASADAGVTLRVGLADYPRDAATPAGLVSEAQEALTFARTADLLVVDRTLLG